MRVDKMMKIKRSILLNNTNNTNNVFLVNKCAHMYTYKDIFTVLDLNPWLSSL